MTWWRDWRVVAVSDGWGSSFTAPPDYIDPGFQGTITLEISNLGHLAVALYPRHAHLPDCFRADELTGQRRLRRQGNMRNIRDSRPPL